MPPRAEVVAAAANRVPPSASTAGSGSVPDAITLGIPAAAASSAAATLLAMPPLLLMVMLLVHRDYAMELFRRPLLLGGMLVSMGFGALWIRWIIHIEY